MQNGAFRLIPLINYDSWKCKLADFSCKQVQNSLINPCVNYTGLSKIFSLSFRNLDFRSAYSISVLSCNVSYKEPFFILREEKYNEFYYLPANDCIAYTFSLK